MGFHDVRFPVGISYGSRGGPSFSTSIIKVDSGSEERVARWSTPHYLYDAAYGVKARDTMVELIAFYNARMGPANSFRYKDFADFASTANGRAPTAGEPSLTAVATTDQQLGIGDDTTTNFQLIKRYTSGATTQLRTITKPVGGTVLVSLDDVNQGSGWTVNLITGVVTFTTAPTAGVVVKAGYEFDVPVRFGDSIDEGGLQSSVDSFDETSVPSVPLVEDVTTTQLNEEIQYGGAFSVGFAADITISWLNGRVQTLTPTGGGLSAKLPDTTLMVRGGPIGFLFNPSTFSIAVKSFTGASLFTLPAASGGVPGSVELLLGDLSGAATWFWN